MHQKGQQECHRYLLHELPNQQHLQHLLSRIQPDKEALLRRSLIATPASYSQKEHSQLSLSHLSLGLALTGHLELRILRAFCLPLALQLLAVARGNLKQSLTCLE